MLGMYAEFQAWRPDRSSHRSKWRVMGIMQHRCVTGQVHVWSELAVLEWLHTEPALVLGP